MVFFWAFFRTRIAAQQHHTGRKEFGSAIYGRAHATVSSIMSPHGSEEVLDVFGLGEDTAIPRSSSHVTRYKNTSKTVPAGLSHAPCQ